MLPSKLLPAKLTQLKLRCFVANLISLFEFLVFVLIYWSKIHSCYFLCFLHVWTPELTCSLRPSGAQDARYMMYEDLNSLTQILPTY